MKSILVFGATSAIAQECIKIWAARNCNLFLVARNEELLQTIVKDTSTRGANFVFSVCTDINQIDQHSEIINLAIEKLGTIDLVLIAHGTLCDQMEVQTSVPATMEEIQTNALSAISILTVISNYFEKNNSGHIAIISSVAGDRGRANNYIYGSAKAMLSTFASGLRQRLAQSNVAVLTVKPGFVDTPMTERFKKGFLWANPSQVAKSIIWAIDQKKDEIYVPRFWGLIMIIIKLLPISIFKRLKF